MGFAKGLSIVPLVGGFFIDSRLARSPSSPLSCCSWGHAGFRMMYKTYMRFFSEDKTNGDRK
jgi:hypothetical protein